QPVRRSVGGQRRQGGRDAGQDLLARRIVGPAPQQMSRSGRRGFAHHHHGRQVVFKALQPFGGVGGFVARQSSLVRRRRVQKRQLQPRPLGRIALFFRNGGEVSQGLTHRQRRQL